MSESIDLAPAFLEIAACPSCHSSFAVDYDSSELVCSNAACGLAYPVRDGIPILLIDEARKPSQPGPAGEARKPSQPGPAGEARKPSQPGPAAGGPGQR